MEGLKVIEQIRQLSDIPVEETIPESDNTRGVSAGNSSQARVDESHKLLLEAIPVPQLVPSVHKIDSIADQYFV
jgi:hypothetical protein